MAKIKLNPLVDLGLASDPNYKASPEEVNANNLNQSSEIQFDSDGLQSAPIENNSPISDTKSNELPNSFDGISEISTFTPSENQQQKVQAIESTSYVSPISEPVASESKSNEEHTLLSNSLLIISVILFLISVGALLFFLLRYFRIV